MAFAIIHTIAPDAVHANLGHVLLFIFKVSEIQAFAKNVKGWYGYNYGRRNRERRY